MVPYPAPPPALVSHSTPEDWEKYGLRGFGKGVRGEKRGTATPPPPSTVRCRPSSTAAGVREKMCEIRYDRTPRTAAASPSPPPSSTVRCCRHSPPSAPPHRSSRGRVGRSSSQIQKRKSPREPGPREGEIERQERAGEGGTDRDFGV